MIIDIITIRNITGWPHSLSSMLYKYPLSSSSFLPTLSLLKLVMQKVAVGESMIQALGLGDKRSSDIDLMRRVSRSPAYKTYRHCKIFGLLHHREDIEVLRKDKRTKLLIIEPDADLVVKGEVEIRSRKVRCKDSELNRPESHVHGGTKALDTTQ
jgi:hypothetical protein